MSPSAPSTRRGPSISDVVGYLLDTNVLSELLKKRPEPTVVRSLNVITAEDLFIGRCITTPIPTTLEPPDTEPSLGSATLLIFWVFVKSSG